MKEIRQYLLSITYYMGPGPPTYGIPHFWTTFLFLIHIDRDMESENRVATTAKLPMVREHLPTWC